MPIEVTNIRREEIPNMVSQKVNVANKKDYIHADKAIKYMPYELNVAKQVNSPYKSSIVISHIPSSEMTRDYQIPSRRGSYSSTTDSISSEEIMPHMGVINNNLHFRNVPLAHKNLAPYVANTFSGTLFEPKTRQVVNGNYSYTPNQFGNNSQNKHKNSLKKRFKDFIAGPSRIVQQPKQQTRKALRKTRKMRK